MKTNIVSRPTCAGKIIATESHWIGNSHVRIRVRIIGSKNCPQRVMVDLFEIFQEGDEVDREILNQSAVNYAMAYGASSPHFLVLRDYVTARKVNDHLIRGESFTIIREKSYTFKGF